VIIVNYQDAHNGGSLRRAWGLEGARGGGAWAPVQCTGGSWTQANTLALCFGVYPLPRTGLRGVSPVRPIPG